ncbi:hypothetical protein PIB30_026277 [Stylosanthes scabra]|uniref:Uncharacterized protein n=1 Tax=Stylosanthes scabra TaxID=79078 RepID=A0ABU6TB44_9FABA|nr:hypothetical protein [Stylosanthes scabra]
MLKEDLAAVTFAATTEAAAVCPRAVTVADQEKRERIERERVEVRSKGRRRRCCRCHYAREDTVVVFNDHDTATVVRFCHRRLTTTEFLPFTQFFAPPWVTGIHQ